MRRTDGFTLVELSIVRVIICLLVGGILIPFDAPASEAAHVLAGSDPETECTQQVLERSVSEKWNEIKGADYSSHYSVKLGRCFVLLKTRNATPPYATLEMLEGAPDGKTYGMFLATPDEKEPEICKVTDSLGERKICHSEAEFNDLTKDYLQ
jgi:prepilin-type N-terminal cleavage/methylation domain-containing protein